jgi:hypothetical protein
LSNLLPKLLLLRRCAAGDALFSRYQPAVPPLFFGPLWRRKTQ